MFNWRRKPKWFRKWWTRITKQVEIKHWLECDTLRGHYVLTSVELIPETEMRSINERHILEQYHIPWERQIRSEYNLYETWNDNSYWETVKYE